MILYTHTHTHTRPLQNWWTVWRESRNLIKIEEGEGLYSKNRPLFICTTKVRQGKSVNPISGITLIALVVTIVVLLILASVSITVVFGDNGILELAKEAGEKTNEAVQKDIQDIQNLEDTLGDIVNNGWSLSKVTAVTSADGKIVPVPKGFVASSATGENRVADGFVIYEGTESVTDDNVDKARTDRNQFVWVPLEDINDMIYCYKHPNAKISYDEINEKLVCSECEIGTETNFAGKLYASGEEIKQFTSDNPNTEYNSEAKDYKGLREPDVVTELYEGRDEFDTKTENLKIVLKNYKEGNNANTLKEQLQKEFNEMSESAGKYKGFYIGRYETSNLSNTGDTYLEVSTGKVVKGASTIHSAMWYRQYVSNKKIGSSYSDIAKTSIIWGCQWDATMKWFLSNNDETVKKYVTDGTGKGNYSNPVSTASNPEYAVNNIYDMAGNVWDWTMESFNGNHRILRGGSWQDAGVNLKSNASDRISYYPTGVNDNAGSRSVLYVI